MRKECPLFSVVGATNILSSGNEGTRRAQWHCEAAFVLGIILCWCQGFLKFVVGFIASI